MQQRSLVAGRSTLCTVRLMKSTSNAQFSLLFYVNIYTVTQGLLLKTHFISLFLNAKKIS